MSTFLLRLAAFKVGCGSGSLSQKKKYIVRSMSKGVLGIKQA